MKTGRPRTCECGTCQKCRSRDRARERYQSLSMEERRAIIAARDSEKVRAADRARYYRNREGRLARMREWYERNKDKLPNYNAAWRARNPEKRYAHGVVAHAKRSGLLIPQPCEDCGADEPTHAHHDDYSKPLEVRWLCSACHNRFHRRYQEAA